MDEMEAVSRVLRGDVGLGGINVGAGDSAREKPRTQV